MTWVPWQPFQSDWNRRYIPSRGLAYSFVIHELALFACFTYSMVAGPKIVLRTPEEEIKSAEVLYLPTTGGGDSGGTEGKRGKEGEGKAASGAKHEGVTFKGPQYIRSEYPNPDNNLQTILQPALTNAPKLNFPLQVPNIIKVARPKPQPQVTPPKVQVKTAVKDLPVPSTAQKPVLKAEAEPIATSLHSEKVPLLALPEMQPLSKTEPERIVVAPEPKAQPLPVITANASMASESLAILNAVRINMPQLVIPPGEKRASFEVSPNGTATARMANTRGGVPGGKPDAGSGDGAGTAKAGAGSEAGGSGSGKAGAGGGGSGSGSGSGSTGTGHGHGDAGIGAGSSGRTGSGSSRGPGSGNGNGTGAGSGSGSGPGDGPFPGIQVIGGEGSGISGIGGGLPKPAPAPRNYDFTIVASGGSGGGLKDFGVFRNQAVYTVYLDVSDVAPTSQAWVLQYADNGSGPRTAEVTLGSNGTLSAPQAMLEPPYAIEKHVPEKLGTPANNAMTVITGIISRDGKFERGRVLQAPSEEYGEQWAAALAAWSFRAASKGGTPVAVRVLIGIPVY